MKKNTLLLCSLGFVSFTSLSPALDLVPFEATWDYMHPTNNVDPAIADADFDTTWFLGATDFAA